MPQICITAVFVSCFSYRGNNINKIVNDGVFVAKSVLLESTER